MQTPCHEQRVEFHHLNAERIVTCDFEGGDISGNGGVQLIAEVDRIFNVTERLANCFEDHRKQDAVEHPLLHLLRQRIYGICLGYEDLIDHDDLRGDPGLAAVIGKEDPTGQDRRREADRGKPLAGKSTLDRLELTKAGAGPDTPDCKIVACLAGIGDLLVEVFIEQHLEPPSEIVLDIDPSDVTTYGEQFGQFFNGHYDDHCFLPQFVFCGEFPLAAVLRPGNAPALEGARRLLERIVARLHTAWPDTVITIRGDGAFCDEDLMAWCERTDRLEYCFGMPKNARIEARVRSDQRRMARAVAETGEAQRVYRSLDYRTKDSWSRSRHLAVKVEHLPGQPGDSTSSRTLAARRCRVAELEARERRARESARAAWQWLAETRRDATLVTRLAVRRKASAPRDHSPSSRAVRDLANKTSAVADRAQQRARQARRQACKATADLGKARAELARARGELQWEEERAGWTGKSNVRVVVTSRSPEEHSAQETYAHVYCARGEAENRIKEVQLELFSDRLPCERMRSNQIRLYLSTFSYLLMVLLRRHGLAETKLSRAQTGTIRSRLLRVGAQVKVTVRRVWLHLSSSHPYRELLVSVMSNLAAARRRWRLCAAPGSP